ncbi:MAG: hypothetical protein AAF533_11535 [Acidobacteriota bacterium]
MRVTTTTLRLLVLTSLLTGSVHAQVSPGNAGHQIYSLRDAADGEIYRLLVTDSDFDGAGTSFEPDRQYWAAMRMTALADLLSDEDEINFLLSPTTLTQFGSLTWVELDYCPWDDLSQQEKSQLSLPWAQGFRRDLQGAPNRSQVVMVFESSAGVLSGVTWLKQDVTELFTPDEDDGSQFLRLNGPPSLVDLDYEAVSGP